MKTNIENWDDSIMDIEDYQAERAMQRGIIDAMRRAQKLGTDFITEENGQIKRIGPNDIPEQERQALLNLERLNRIIADFEKTQSPYILNDSPKSKS